MGFREGESYLIYFYISYYKSRNKGSLKVEDLKIYSARCFKDSNSGNNYDITYLNTNIGIPILL